VSVFSVLEFLSSGCIFSSGDQIGVGWGKPQRTEILGDSAVAIYAPDFFLLDSRPWWNFPHYLKFDRSQLVQVLESISRAKSLHWEEADYELFAQTFGELKKLFESGSLRKAVPVVFKRAESEVESALKANWLSQVLTYTRELPLYIYGIWHREEGMLGATPEILFEKDGTHLDTVALAGTRLKGSTAEPLLPLLPLLEDPKELEEHRIVIEGISDSLAGFGEVTVGKTAELMLPTLSHLRTPIWCALNPAGEFDRFFEKVVRELHPTPALGAFPRTLGLEWLRTYQENLDRRRFGAPFGVVQATGKALCLVSIRNLQWADRTVFLGAGCGIVPASQLDREWLEIQAKMASVMKMFGLAL
jgi:isochorismate synthase EntC